MYILKDCRLSHLWEIPARFRAVALPQADFCNDWLQSPLSLNSANFAPFGARTPLSAVHYRSRPSAYKMADADLGESFIPALRRPPALLPIAKHREALLYLIETYPVTVVVGQTGSGKSTQIPQFLRQAGWCADGRVIAITQVCLPLSLQWF